MRNKKTNPWRKPAANEPAEVTIPYDHGFGTEIFDVLFIKGSGSELTYQLRSKDKKQVFSMYAAKCKTVRRVSAGLQRIDEVKKILSRTR